MPISIEEARSALLGARSEAADEEHFAGRRLTGGWLFSWSAGGDIPAGTSGWVVADNGAVRPLGFGDTPDALLATLNAS